MSGGDDMQRGAHEVREFLCDCLGVPYKSYGSLTEAQAADDGAVILSGDYGGTIFLTVPARHVHCDEAILATLVADLDAVTWMSGDPTIATVAFEARPVPCGVPGGDGGGVVVDGVWTHPAALPEEIAAQAVEVVQGRRARIDTTVLREARERELARKRPWREAHPPSSERVRALGWDFDIRNPLVPFDP